MILPRLTRFDKRSITTTDRLSRPKYKVKKYNLQMYSTTNYLNSKRSIKQRLKTLSHSEKTFRYKTNKVQLNPGQHISKVGKKAILNKYKLSQDNVFKGEQLKQYNYKYLASNPFIQDFKTFKNKKHEHDFSFFYSILKDAYEPFFSLTQLDVESLKKQVENRQTDEFIKIQKQVNKDANFALLKLLQQVPEGKRRLFKVILYAINEIQEKSVEMLERIKTKTQEIKEKALVQGKHATENFIQCTKLIADKFNMMYDEQNMYGRDGIPTKNNIVLQIKNLKQILEMNQPKNNLSSTVNYVEEQFEYITRRHQQALIELKKQRKENQSLTSLYENLQKKIKGYEVDIVKIQIERKRREKEEGKDDNLTVLKKFQQQKLDILNDEKAELEQKISFLKGINKKLTVRLGNIEVKEIQETTCKNKGVQVNLFLKQYGQSKIPNVQEILIKPGIEILTSQKNKKKWTMLVIACILNEKLIADMHDSYEKRLPESLQNVCVQWFYKRFGCQKMALSITTDFLSSIKNYYDTHERFSLFSNLCGLPFTSTSEKQISLNKLTEENEEDMKDNTTLNQDLIIKRFYSSQKAIKIYLKIANMKNQTYYHSHKIPYIPQVPNIFYQGKELVRNEAAQKITETILIEENVDEQTIKKYQDHFFEIVQADLYQRLQQSEEIKETGQGISITFDFLCRFILQIVCKEELKKFSGIYTALKVNQEQVEKDSYLSAYQFHQSLQISGSNLSEREKQIAFTRIADLKMQQYIPLNLSIFEIFNNLQGDNNSCFNKPEKKVLKKFLEQHPRPNDDQYQIITSKNDLIKEKMYSGGLVQDGQGEYIINNPYHKRKLVSIISSKSKDKENSVLNATLFAYDIISNISLLEETYKIYKKVFQDQEKFKDEVMHYHRIFQLAMYQLPKNINFTEDHPHLLEFNKIDLINKIENAWEHFRNLLTKVFMK